MILDLSDEETRALLNLLVEANRGRPLSALAAHAAAAGDPRQVLGHRQPLYGLRSGFSALARAINYLAEKIKKFAKTATILDDGPALRRPVMLCKVSAFGTASRIGV
jgi:hypothetical protein